MNAFEEQVLAQLAASWHVEASKSTGARADQLRLCAQQLGFALASLLDGLEVIETRRAN